MKQHDRLSTASSGSRNMARDPQEKRRIPKAKRINVENDDGTVTTFAPVPHGEVHLIFRDGRVVEDQVIVRNKHF